MASVKPLATARKQTAAAKAAPAAPAARKAPGRASGKPARPAAAHAPSTTPPARKTAARPKPAAAQSKRSAAAQPGGIENAHAAALAQSTQEPPSWRLAKQVLPSKRVGNSTEAAYQRLRQKIMDSELAPGSQVLEQELVLMLGLSRTPIREALIRLQLDGLVQVIPRHGVRIVPTSISDIKEIYEVLISLEPTAAALLAAAQPAVDVAPLEAACADMTAALAGGDMQAWALADEAFHLQLVHLSGNRRLAEIVMTCWDQVHRVRQFTQRLRAHPQPRESIAEHYAIIAAIRAGDAARAGELYRKHRERGWRDQTAVLQQYRIQQA
jgi:DNA-binding GntR family transcriptional regulator